MNWKLAGIGFIFALLWASASAATKIALQSAQPFVIAVTRFFIAAAIMLTFAYGIKKYRLPAKEEWGKLMLYGLLNISIYLGLYVIGMQKISAGLGTLAVGMNPVMISIMAAFIFKQPIGSKTITSLLLCLCGVMVAAYPLLQTSYASLDGILIILGSMVAYSAGAIYFSKTNWNGLDLIAINGWQTLLGGIFLLPVLLLTYKGERNNFDLHFWSGDTLACTSRINYRCSVLVIPASDKPGKSGLLVISLPDIRLPHFSDAFNEPLSWFTAIGVVLVLVGLYTRNVRSKALETPINE